MLKLNNILQDIKARKRQLSNEENTYIANLAVEMRQAVNEADRWRIIEREGLSRIEFFNLGESVIAGLIQKRRTEANLTA